MSNLDVATSLVLDILDDGPFVLLQVRDVLFVDHETLLGLVRGDGDLRSLRGS